MSLSHQNILTLLLKATVLGLALAFVVILIWPQVLSRLPDPIPQAPPPAVEAPPPALARPAPGRYSYANAVERAAPAVVNINTTKVVQVRTHPLLSDPFFRQLFGGGGAGMMTPQQQRVEGPLGSGVIMNAEGHVLTNHHVIAGTDEIRVSLRDGRMVKARVLGSDPDTDLAVLKIELDDLPSIAVGDAERLRVGDVVLAIGNPFGIGQTVTIGIVSATGRNRVGINTFENFIQTDAAINPGNSGGALVDADGRLVGINSAIFSRSGGYQGIGLAIPISLAKFVAAEIIEHGRPIRGWIGISGGEITPSAARQLGLASTDGVIVIGMMRNGPAHRAGVDLYDVIRAVDGKRTREPRDTLLAIASRKPGSRVKLDLVRANRKLTIEVPVIERPPQAGATE